MIEQEEIKELVEQEVTASVVGMTDENKQRVLAMATAADYALKEMITAWDKLVPQLAGKMLKELAVVPLGPKKQYTLGQRNDAKRMLNEAPFLFAAYIDTLRKILSNDKAAYEAGYEQGKQDAVTEG
jgi:hypothetical protein